jgi:putative addiction module killer protein
MKVKVRGIEYFTCPTGKQPVRAWLDNLKDKVTQAILYKRIRQAGLGNFGKTRSVGGGVQELKIDYGPGYRIYYGIHRDEIILLLTGGSKRTQQSDIQVARQYWKQWQEEYNEN